MLVTNGAFDAIGLIVSDSRQRGVNRVVCAGPILLSVARLFQAAGLEVVVRDWADLIDRDGWQSAPLGEGDLLYVNSPHNPTGDCLDGRRIRNLLDDQFRRRFELIFDLVYDSFIHLPELPATPLASLVDWDGIYAVNSFSKNYGAPGLRVGWLTAEPTAVDRLTARLEWERIAVATEPQLRAASLCEAGNTALVDRVRGGLELVSTWCREHDIEFPPPGGGTQAWLDLDVGDSEQFAEALMRDHRVVLATGANYYPRAPRHVRVPLGLEPWRLAAALDLIATARRRR
jgi:beta-methylarginine biosynthesis bifunctional aminotransferase